MLIKIFYSTHSLGSLNTLAEALTKKATERHPDDAMITACETKLEAAISIARTALGSATGSAYTSEVGIADDLRDFCYRGFRNHVEAGTYRETNQAYKEAADKVYPIFTKNNKLLYSLPYNEETAALESLFNDLDGMTSELDILHATGWLEELKSANEQFKEVLATRSDDTANTVIPTDAEAKAALTDALKIFVSTVDSLSAFGQPAGIGETVTTLNQMIKEANEAVK